jgi:adenosylhomocysteine nucleosidase
MIAVSFALPAESSGFAALLREKQSATCGDMKTIHGKVANQSVAMFHTGVGRKICETRINHFFGTEHPAFLISSGFAGGVREDLEVGDLFLAENFSDRQLLSTVQRVLRDRNVHAGRLFTSKTIVDSVAERDKIVRVNGAIAVDMETEIIAQACAARGIPLLSLRAISDTKRRPFPVPLNVLFDIERQRTNFTRLALYFLKYPNSLPRLIAFAKGVSMARRSLTTALETLLRSDQL